MSLNTIERTWTADDAREWADSMRGAAEHDAEVEFTKRLLTSTPDELIGMIRNCLAELASQSTQSDCSEIQQPIRLLADKLDAWREVQAAGLAAWTEQQAAKVAAECEELDIPF